MLKSETAKLLVFSASIEGREVTDLEVEAWHELLAEVDYDAAVDVAKDHYLTQSRRLWPADVLDGVMDRLVAGEGWTEARR